MTNRATPATAIKSVCVGGAGAEVENLTEHDKAVLRRAQEWVRLNPTLWATFEAWALDEVRHERKFGLQDFVETIRWRDYSNALGEPVKINNSFCPIFARFLVAEHPEARPFVELRHSRWDSVLGR